MTHDPLCALSKAECRASQDARHSIVTNTAWCDACQDDCQCNLIAKVRDDERDKTLDDAIALLWEMNCKRLWWDDMLTWCISVNEAIYNIDNLRGKREVV